MPNMGPTGLVERYAHCVETREPLILDDFLYPSQLLPGPRSFDLRGSYAGIDSICVTWRDTTERFRAAPADLGGQERYRLLAENAGDVVIQVRDDRIVWASPSIEEALGAGPGTGSAGNSTISFLPRITVRTTRSNWLTPDRAFIPRGRLIAVDGTEHWVHVHVRDLLPTPMAPGRLHRGVPDHRRRGARGHRGRRRPAARQAEADARYRRLRWTAPPSACAW